MKGCSQEEAHLGSRVPGVSRLGSGVHLFTWSSLTEVAWLIIL